MDMKDIISRMEDKGGLRAIIQKAQGQLAEMEEVRRVAAKRLEELERNELKGDLGQY